jgi:DNA-binding transcriptional MerR regulator
MTMMMTMTTSNEVELMGEPTESAEPHNSDQLHADIAESADRQELDLGDEHAEALANELQDSPANPVTASEPLSLPAALCDDKLLEEINSIPDKMGFKIGDVADMLSIKQYVLRYWETEFDLLKPKKASNNQRMYTRKDVENAFLIRKLLHRDRFSIEGARNALKELKAHVKKEKDYSQVVNRLDSIHDRIEDLVLEIRRTRQLFK